MLRTIHNFPNINVFWNIAIRWVEAIRILGFARAQHCNGEFGSSGLAQLDTLTRGKRMKPDCHPPSAVALLNNPPAMPVSVPNVMRNPIHALTLDLFGRGHKPMQGAV